MLCGLIFSRCIGMKCLVLDIFVGLMEYVLEIWVYLRHILYQKDCEEVYCRIFDNCFRLVVGKGR